MEDLTDASELLSKNFWVIYRIPLILGAISLTLIVASIYLLFKSQVSVEPIKFESDQASDSGQLKRLIAVDVEGAVIHPGVYKLPDQSRIEDAIVQAGGLSDQADKAKISATINLAQKVSDGAKLYLPFKGETNVSVSQGVQSSNLSSFSNLININSASLEQLDTLSGVGPVTAKKIIDNRPYLTLEELVSKKAMTQSVFTKLKSQLTL